MGYRHSQPEENKPKQPLFQDAKQLSLLNKDILQAYAQSKFDNDVSRLLVTIETLYTVNIHFVNDPSFVDRIETLKKRWRVISETNARDESFYRDLWSVERDLMYAVMPVVARARRNENEGEVDWDQFKRESDL